MKTKQPEFAQNLDPYEVTLTEIAQIKRALFANVNAAIVTPSKFAQIKLVLFAHVNIAPFIAQISDLY